MAQIEEDMRLHISEALPAALITAMESYQFFLEREIPDEAKEFKAHHEACKVAIAHIELLIKLAQWADLIKDDDQEDHKFLRMMIENANAEIQKR